MILNCSQIIIFFQSTMVTASVVIPTYNHDQFINEAINSVLCQAKQTRIIGAVLEGS